MIVGGLYTMNIHENQHDSPSKRWRLRRTQGTEATSRPVSGVADPAWNVCVDIAHMSHTWCIYLPIGSMYAIYGNIYHQYTPNVSIYTIHGSYGLHLSNFADNPYTESWSGDFIKWRLQHDSKFARKKNKKTSAACV